MVFVFSRGEPGIDLLKLQGGSSVKLSMICVRQLSPSRRSYLYPQRPEGGPGEHADRRAVCP